MMNNHNHVTLAEAINFISAEDLDNHKATPLGFS